MTNYQLKISFILLTKYMYKGNAIIIKAKHIINSIINKILSMKILGEHQKYQKEDNILY